MGRRHVGTVTLTAGQIRLDCECNPAIPCISLEPAAHVAAAGTPASNRGHATSPAWLRDPWNAHTAGPAPRKSRVITRARLAASAPPPGVD
jgi:hypothetical protein